ncbi:unnamed protein product [Durusdinium trenchii]|uniref:PPPDE domain-containing protein n=1 Tax=Durusdinium trenchii TaxID=1381693 RepID=A0ABP0REW7_9DINO
MLFSSTSSTPRTYQVMLAASELGPYIPGLGQAYHTSVLIDNEEYQFDGNGICVSQGLTSHARFTRGHELILLGHTTQSPKAMVALLKAYFQPGSYDLLRKNCNSFSSCALHYLLESSMDSKYSFMESVAQSVNNYINLVSLIMPNYEPNPFAEGFSVDLVCRDINLQKNAMKGSQRQSRAWNLVWRLQRKAKAGRELLRHAFCGSKKMPEEPTSKDEMDLRSEVI